MKIMYLINDGTINDYKFLQNSKIHNYLLLDVLAFIPKIIKN